MDARSELELLRPFLEPGRRARADQVVDRPAKWTLFLDKVFQQMEFAQAFERSPLAPSELTAERLRALGSDPAVTVVSMTAGTDSGDYPLDEIPGLLARAGLDVLVILAPSRLALFKGEYGDLFVLTRRA